MKTLSDGKIFFQKIFLIFFKKKCYIFELSDFIYIAGIKIYEHIVFFDKDSELYLII